MSNQDQKTAHTPGSWEADRAYDGDNHYYQIDGPTPKGVNPRFPYTVADTMNRHHCISPEEDRDNAYLIAAAPDLLAALEMYEEAIGDLEGQPVEYGTAMKLSRAHKLAQAALAKAEGR